MLRVARVLLYPVHFPDNGTATRMDVSAAFTAPLQESNKHRSVKVCLRASVPALLVNE